MLRKLFGRRSDSPAKEADAGPAEVAATEEYAGFELQAAPIHEGKAWRVAGCVMKLGADVADRQEFVRADTCMSQDDAVAISLRKARQIVDEQKVTGRHG